MRPPLPFLLKLAWLLACLPRVSAERLFATVSADGSWQGAAAAAATQVSTEGSRHHSAETEQAPADVAEREERVSPDGSRRGETEAEPPQADPGERGERASPDAAPPGDVELHALSAWPAEDGHGAEAEAGRPELCLEESQQIPKIVHFAGGSESRSKKVLANNGAFAGPQWQLRYYTDAEMLESARNISVVLETEAGVQGVFEAYLSLRPYAFRVDLWRYMALWLHGGLHLDAQILLVQPLRFWLDLCKDTFVLVTDGPATRNALDQGIHSRTMFYSSMMASTPRQPQLLNLLRFIVSSISRRAFWNAGGGSDWCQYITGAGALTFGLSDPKTTVPLVFSHELAVAHMEQNATFLSPGGSGFASDATYAGRPILLSATARAHGVEGDVMIALVADGFHTKLSYTDTHCRYFSVYCDGPNFDFFADASTDACVDQAEAIGNAVARRQKLGAGAGVALLLALLVCATGRALLRGGRRQPDAACS